MARAVARIDLGAVQRNCARLKAELREGAELCAVVKADGYGHGADACADAALAGGATRLAVATAAEAAQIGRRFPHVPLLTMGALSAEERRRRRSPPARRSRSGARASARLLADRARAQGRPARVHVKHDSGMGRLGNRDPARCSPWPAPAPTSPTSSWPASGPTSRPPTNPTPASSTSSSSASTAVAEAVKAEFPGVIVHAANSAAVFRDRRSHFDMARCGVADLRARPLPGRPGRARPRAGALAALLRRRREALRRRRQRRLRADLAGAGRHLGRRAAARLRRRRPPRPLQQRRGAGPRPPPPAGRHRLDGQRDDRPRARRPRSSRATRRS